MAGSSDITLYIDGDIAGIVDVDYVAGVIGLARIKVKIVSVNDDVRDFI